MYCNVFPLGPRDTFLSTWSFCFVQGFWVNLNMIVSISDLTIYSVGISGKNCNVTHDSIIGETKLILKD